MARMEIQQPAISLAVAAFLGIFVVFVELPCTGAPYLAILGMLSKLPICFRDTFAALIQFGVHIAFICDHRVGISGTCIKKAGKMERRK